MKERVEKCDVIIDFDGPTVIQPWKKTGPSIPLFVLDCLPSQTFYYKENGETWRLSEKQLDYTNIRALYFKKCVFF